MARYSFLLALAAIAACTIPSAAPPSDTTPPTGTVLINNDDSYTVSTSVTLALSAADDDAAGVTQMRVSNTTDFAGAGWQSFAASLAWTLTDGDGPKTVYADFRDAAGNPSEVSSDSIALDTTLPGPPDPPDLAEEDDTGLDNNDNVTRQTSGLTFSGMVEPDVTAVHLYDTTRGLQGSVALGPPDLGAWSLELSLAEGTYALYVKAEDIVGLSPSSSPLALIVDTTPPAAPGLLKPALGENTGANKRPAFAWVSLAEAGSYELQVDDSADFSSPEHHWTDLSGTSYRPGTDLAASAAVQVGTRYYLRMRAVDAAGNLGDWGSTPGLRYVNVGRFDNDFNGDGYADVIVGATFYSSYTGRAYIYYGGAVLNNGADLTLTGETAGDYLGGSVASAGDVNGDGYADALVGARDYGTGQGRAYLYFGGSTMDNVADVTMTGQAASSYFGYSVSTAGDVNADGYADVIVGSPYDNSYQGRAYLFHGGPAMVSLNPAADLILSEAATGNQFAWSVASAGDVDGDGYPDAIVGARGYNNYQGRAYLYRGGSAMDATADLTLSGQGTQNYFGNSVAPAGDVDGDGYADALVGAFGYNGNRGRVYLYRGGPVLDTTADLLLDGEAVGDASRFGFSAAPAGDVDRDGYGDLLIGAYYWSGAAGKAYLYRGGPAMDAVADLALYGAGTLAGYFGYSAASAGDVNGDGYADLVVGAYGENGSNGRAYLFRGGAALDATSDLTMSATAYFGFSVASLGAGPGAASRRLPT